MSPELHPMAVHYYCHVSPSVSRNQFTALPLEELWSRDTYITYGYIWLHIYVLVKLWQNFMFQSTPEVQVSAYTPFNVSFTVLLKR